MGGVLRIAGGLSVNPRRSLAVGGLAIAGLGLGLLAARAPLIVLVGALGGVALVAASLLEPLLGLGFALLVGPSRAWLEIVSPGLAPHIGQFVLMTVLVAWATRLLWLREKVIIIPPSVWMLGLFIFVGLLSLLRPADLWVGFLEWVKWLQILLAMCLVFDRIAKLGDRGIHIAVAGLLGSGLAQAAIGLWQFAIRGEGVEQFHIMGRFYRAYGTFQQPNPYAGLTALVAAVSAGLLLQTLADWWRGGRKMRGLKAVFVPAVPTALLVAGLGASWSRGGWMGFAAATLVMVALLPRRGYWGALLVVLAFVAGGVLLATGRLPPPIVSRLTGFLSYVQFKDVRGSGVTDATFAVMERMAHWQAALGMWRDNFWLGVGLGCYEPAYPAYRLINWVLPLGHAHNAYLNVAAETGLLGLAAYGVWGGGLVYHSVRAIMLSTGWRRGLALGLLGAWVHFAAHSVVDNLLVNNVHLHVAVLAALTATLGHAGHARGNPRGARAHTDGGQPSMPWLTIANLDALGRAEDLRIVTGVGRRA